MTGAPPVTEPAGGSRVARAFAGVPVLGALRGRVRNAGLAAVALIPVSAIAGYSRTPLLSGRPTDYSVFGPTGADLLRGRWDLVYAHSNNAGGPFELVPWGIAWLLHVSGPVAWTILYTILITVLVFLVGVVLLAPMPLRPGRSSFYITLGVGALGIFCGVFTGAAFSAHTADVLIPLLWLVGVIMARDGNFVAFGITVGLSVGFETWGVLGFVLVFVAVRPRLVLAAIAGIATVGIIYLPFVATGSFRLFGLSWPVFPVSIYGLFSPHLHQFTWELRALQSVGAIIVAVLVAVLVRGSGSVVWLAPMSLLAARLVLDPLLLSYYWVAPQTVALVTLAVGIASRRWLVGAVAAAVLVALWAPKPAPLVDAVGLLVVVVAFAIIGRVRPRLALWSAAAAEDGHAVGAGAATNSRQ